MKCEVFWMDGRKQIHEPRGVEATHITIASALDDDGGANSSIYPTIFLVCEKHAHLGERSGWVTISTHVARHIGQHEEVLRKGP